MANEHLDSGDEVKVQLGAGGSRFGVPVNLPDDTPESTAEIALLSVLLTKPAPTMRGLREFLADIERQVSQVPDHTDSDDVVWAIREWQRMIRNVT